MRTVNIMSGVPGSGKTTYIKNNANWSDTILHRDEFRNELRVSLNSTEYFPVPAAEEWERWTAKIDAALALPQTIWIDQTTIGVGALGKLINGIALTEEDQIVIHVFNVPLQVAITRNSFRTGTERVPDDVMSSMHKNFTKNMITKSSAKRVMLGMDVQFHND